MNGPDAMGRVGCVRRSGGLGSRQPQRRCCVWTRTTATGLAVELTVVGDVPRPGRPD
ncbi:MAG TPA: hypothetical protein VGM14_26625 [Streptosporangiaceae bacterium]